MIMRDYVPHSLNCMEGLFTRKNKPTIVYQNAIHKIVHVLSIIASRLTIKCGNFHVILNQSTSTVSVLNAQNTFVLSTKLD